MVKRLSLGTNPPSPTPTKRCVEALGVRGPSYTAGLGSHGVGIVDPLIGSESLFSHTKPPVSLLAYQRWPQRWEMLQPTKDPAQWHCLIGAYRSRKNDHLAKTAVMDRC